MPVILLHLDTYNRKYDIDPDMRSLRFDCDPVLAAKLLGSDRYVAVATVETDDVENAWKKTQNGVESDSWSRRPPVGVTPLGTGVLALSGQLYGYRSSDLADIVIKDDEVHMVADFGFKKLDIPPPDLKTIRVIGTDNIMLADALEEPATPAPR